jgi:hypothetical protein
LKIMKKALFVLFAFGVLNLCGIQSSFSQGTGERISGKVGVLGFTTLAPAGWRAGTEAEEKANEILASESVKQKASFATMFGPKGPIIYGTWKEFPTGYALSAAQIAGSVSESAFPSGWSLVPGELKVQTRILSSRIEYAYWRIVASGDGRQFGGGRPVKTLGVWIDIPIAYKEGGKIGGGIASLYLRGAESDFKGTSKHSAEQLLITLADSLAPVNAEIVPLEAVTANSGGKKTAGQQASAAVSENPSEISVEMQLGQATAIINDQNSSGASMLAACDTIRQHISWKQRPSFKSLNPELQRLDAICESRLERAILSVRIQAEISETDKLKAYLAPLYDSARKAGPSVLCEFLRYVDSVWEKNDFKRPNQCP